MERVESSSRGLSGVYATKVTGNVGVISSGLCSFYLRIDSDNDELCTVLLFNWRRTR